MLLYLDDAFADHETGNHPECPERIRRINRHLREVEFDQRCERPTWCEASLEQVTRIHQADYLHQLRESSEAGGGRIEADTVISRRSYEVALWAAGAATDAVDRVLTGADHQAACLVRPPGHHALKAAPMGFCLINHVAVAVRHALADGKLNRVLIVDFDVHHGNGTQDAFWTDPQVGFFSMHRWPFYPGTGAADETGSGRGQGTTQNLPITMGTPPEAIVDRFRLALERFAQSMTPELVILSAGFDAHRDDPIGSLGLEQTHFVDLTDAIADVAATHCEGRVVSLLEGGYDLESLPRCVEAHLRQLSQRAAP